MPAWNAMMIQGRSFSIKFLSWVIKYMPAWEKRFAYKLLCLKNKEEALTLAPPVSVEESTTIELLNALTHVSDLIVAQLGMKW